MVEVSPSPGPVHDGFAGHLGHLTQPQQASLETFRENLSRVGLYTPASSDGTTLASCDDITLLRFLRARGFSPTHAQTQFAATQQWRKDHDVDRLYPTFDVDEFEEARRFYPRWTGRRDKHGLPLYVYRLASLELVQKELDAVPPQRRYQRIISLYEYMTHFTFPLCSSLPHFSSSPSSTTSSTPTPISSTTSIIDLSAVSFSSIWKLRHHLQESSILGTANYPETLGMVVVVNSPSFFSTIWGWIKGWFDEGTRNKIYFLGTDPGPTLRTLIDVQDLPKAYGGELEWTFEDEPSLDEDARKAVGGEMPRGPAIFVDGRVERLGKSGTTTT